MQEKARAHSGTPRRRGEARGLSFVLTHSCGSRDRSWGGSGNDQVTGDDQSIAGDD